MTAAIAAKYDLKLWRIDFVGAYLNSLTKEDVYMKQPEGFVEPGFVEQARLMQQKVFARAAIPKHVAHANAACAVRLPRDDVSM